MEESRKVIADFSPHLFWDVDRNKLEMDKHKEFIIGRALDYGLIGDWRIIKAYYGIKGIAEIAINIKDLSPESRALVSNLSRTPKEKFKCYITQQSTPKHWHF